MNSDDRNPRSLFHLLPQIIVIAFILTGGLALLTEGLGK